MLLYDFVPTLADVFAISNVFAPALAGLEWDETERCRDSVRRRSVSDRVAEGRYGLRLGDRMVRG